MADMRLVSCLLILRGAALALAALLSGCGGGHAKFDGRPASQNLPKPRDYPIHGIDVSKFQGDIDWNA